MNMQVGGVEAGNEWAFNLGQMHFTPGPVDAIAGPNESKSRQAGDLRRSIVRSREPNRERMILRECLVNVVAGRAPCQDCLLYRTSMCPSRA